jgi:hypothetical protein
MYKEKHSNSNGSSLVILGGSGQGRRVIDFPKDGYIPDLQQASSPDGKWLAFFQGPDEWLQKGEFPLNLNLNLLYIPDGKIQTITTLVSTGHASLVLNWSIDGCRLAFTGNINGDLTDLYIYDLDKGSIRQMTNLSIKINEIDWSPDDKWILLNSLSMMEGGVYQKTSIHIVDPHGTAMQKPEAIITGLWLEGLGWVGPESYLIFTQSEGCCGPYGFGYFNASTKQEIELWGSAVTGYAMDPNKGVLAIGSAPEMEINGSYLVRLNGEKIKISEDIFWTLVYRGGIDSEFLGFDGIKVMAISPDGLLTHVSDKAFQKAGISPDGKAFVLYEAYKKVIGMDLFSEHNKFVKTISDKKVSGVIWRPDSKGLVFIADGLYYYEIAGGDTFLLDACEPQGCSYWYFEDNFVWLP